MGSGILSKAAIASIEGATVVTSKENGLQTMNLTTEEIKELVKACKGDESCFASGIYMEGTKYIVANRLENQLNLKSSKMVNDVKVSASVIMTRQYVIVAVDKDGSLKGPLANNLYKYAQYLLNTGY